MTEMATEIETPSPVYLEWLVGDIESPCDFGGDGNCDPDPAKWVMHGKCPTCGAGGARLACDGCKTARLQSEDGVECDYCSEVIVPARKAYSYVEAL